MSSSASSVRICYITVPDQEVCLPATAPKLAPPLLCWVSTFSFSLCCADEQAADTLSSKLVENKLAACVNVIPGIKSTYLWQGKVESDFELLLMVKTRAELTEKIGAFIKENHPYDTPVSA